MGKIAAARLWRAVIARLRGAIVGNAPSFRTTWILLTGGGAAFSLIAAMWLRTTTVTPIAPQKTLAEYQGVHQPKPIVNEEVTRIAKPEITVSEEVTRTAQPKITMDGEVARMSQIAAQLAEERSAEEKDLTLRINAIIEQQRAHMALDRAIRWQMLAALERFGQ